MRRGWVGFCCLAALVAAAAFAADDAEKAAVGPSLEYRPPKPILPEPKGPTPAPRVAIFREAFGSFGIGRGSFDKPKDVAIGLKKNIYVLDAGNNRVQMFDWRNNEFVLQWGSYGESEKKCEFKGLVSIHVVPEWFKSLLRIDQPEDIVLVVDAGQHMILQWTGGVTANCTSVAWGDYGIRDGLFNRPLDIAFGIFQNQPSVWVLDSGNERIQRFWYDDKRKGPFVSRLTYADEISNLTGDRGDLRGLVSLAWSQEESFDYLYLLGTGCSLQKFKLANLPVLDTTWPAVAPESGLCVPARVRYDSEKEYLYVLDSGNGLLSTFHRKGNFIGAMRGADRNFRRPGGFALMPESGEFVVADTGNDLVQKFTLR